MGACAGDGGLPAGVVPSLRSPIYRGSDLHVPPVYAGRRHIPSLGAAGFSCPFEISFNHCWRGTLSVLLPIPPQAPCHNSPRVEVLVLGWPEVGAERGRG